MNTNTGKLANKAGTENSEGTKRFKDFIKMPHTFVILMFLIFAASILTYVLPSGEFERVEDEATGRTLVVPGSYTAAEGHPVSLLEIPLAIVNGMVGAADIVFFIFIIGGTFQIINSTGAIDAVAARIGKTFMNKGLLIIPVFIGVFSVGGFTMGMSSEVLAFVPISIAIARSLGYDAVTGTAMTMLGASVGFTAGLMNPFNVGVAQAIAEVQIFSGMGLRAILLLVLIAITAGYIIRYARKVKADPKSSIVYDLEQEEKGENKIDFSSLPALKLSHIIILATIALGFGVLIWGVRENGWWMHELAAFFLGLGVIVGFLAKYGPSRIASEFVKGASAITFGAFIVGIAQGVVVVLEQGVVVDTVINSMAGVVGQLPASIQVLGMYGFQVIMNVFITSGTGQAAATMPILVPLADLINISRQTTVLVFQLGDGLTNAILPTSSMLMGSLAVSRIKYQEWVKFIWPLILIWLCTGFVFVLVAQAIGY